MTSEIRIRRARESDRQAMLEITREVWGGTDYLPLQWDNWLADPTGLLMVAVKGNRPVGIQHLYVQPDGCCWMEGIRVASDQQGQGVAQVMFDRGVSWARHNDCSSVRLTTSSGNPASRRVAAKGGLRVVQRFQPLIATPFPDFEHPPTVRLAHPGDVDAVWRHLNASGSAFYSEGWTAYRLTKERLRLLLAMSSVMIAGAQRRGVLQPPAGQQVHIDGVAIATCFDTFTTLRVGLLTGPLDSRQDLLRYSRRAAAEAGLEEVRATLALDEIGLQASRETGFEASFDFSVELWELVL